MMTSITIGDWYRILFLDEDECIDYSVWELMSFDEQRFHFRDEYDARLSIPKAEGKLMPQKPWLLQEWE